MRAVDVHTGRLQFVGQVEGERGERELAARIRVGSSARRLVGASARRRVGAAAVPLQPTVGRPSGREPREGRFPARERTPSADALSGAQNGAMTESVLPAARQAEEAHRTLDVPGDGCRRSAVSLEEIEARQVTQAWQRITAWLGA
ncbi:hypothetical protein, partial [Streptomyces echinoruber]|uniref:hypothetical protein n=1 Tax=Streptomyces echinoruber TaxID=68898 RepID=UPI00167EB941